jgi:hypothetical protein
MQRNKDRPEKEEKQKAAEQFTINKPLQVVPEEEAHTVEDEVSRRPTPTFLYDARLGTVNHQVEYRESMFD